MESQNPQDRQRPVNLDAKKKNAHADSGVICQEAVSVNTRPVTHKRTWGTFNIDKHKTLLQEFIANIMFIDRGSKKAKEVAVDIYKTDSCLCWSKEGNLAFYTQASFAVLPCFLLMNRSFFLQGKKLLHR